MAAIIPILTLSGSSNSVDGYNDPKHCRGYNDCYGIGYDDGYLDAQKGLSPAFACVNHSQAWCAGYTDGYRPSNGGSNIFYGHRSDQSTNINIHGDNNKIDINQQTNNQIRTNGFTSGHKTTSVLPKCVILCLNSNIIIK